MWCLCNVWVLMHCSGVYAMFGCWCNVWVFMHCFGFYAMFGCWCIVWVLMKYLGVDILLIQKIVQSVIAASIIAIFRTSLDLFPIYSHNHQPKQELKSQLSQIYINFNFKWPSSWCQVGTIFTNLAIIVTELSP